MIETDIGFICSPEEIAVFRAEMIKRKQIEKEKRFEKYDAMSERELLIHICEELHKLNSKEIDLC